MKKQVLISLTSAFLILLVTLSCSHDDEPLTKRRGSPLQVGNYWVYLTKITQPDNFSYVAFYDSIWISKDTIINNFQYKIVNDIYGRREFMYDSLGSVYRKAYNYSSMIHAGPVVDTIENRDPWFLHNSKDFLDVPAGKFMGYKLKWIVREYDNLSSDYPIYPKIGNNFRSGSEIWWSDEVGYVKMIYYPYGSKVEEELVRYRVK